MTRPPHPPPSPTLGQVIQNFLDYLSNFRRCAPSTARAYASDLAGFAAFCQVQGLEALTEVDRPVLERYFSSLPHLAANTLRRRAHVLSSFCEYAVRQRLMSANPVRGLPLPRRPRRQRRFPDAGQSQALLAAAGTPLEQIAIWLLLTGGLRRQELLDLDLASLSPDRTALTIQGKGEAQRQIPLPPATVQVLGGYLVVRGTAPGPLLLSRAGTRLGKTTLRRLFLRLCRRAGLAECGFTLHSTRHAYATLLLRSGADLATVARLLGHSSLEVTSVYLHSDAATCQAAVAALPLSAPGGEGHE